MDGFVFQKLGLNSKCNLLHKKYSYKKLGSRIVWFLKKFLEPRIPHRIGGCSACGTATVLLRDDNIRQLTAHCKPGYESSKNHRRDCSVRQRDAAVYQAPSRLINLSQTLDLPKYFKNCLDPGPNYEISFTRPSLYINTFRYH